MNHAEYRHEMLSDDPCDEEPDEGVEDSGECEMCGGPVGVLGTLGNRTHFQCRNCGAESSREVIR